MQTHPIVADLVRDIDAFIARSGITPTEFGRKAIRDPNLYRGLKAGRNPRFETIDRIRAFMEKPHV